MKANRKRFALILLVCLSISSLIYLRSSGGGPLTLSKVSRDVAGDEWTGHGPHSTNLHNTLTKEYKPLKLSPAHVSSHSSLMTGVEKVLDNVKTCLTVTNMSQLANESLALANAEFFYREFRKIIPSTFLANYSSHCWNMHYDVALTQSVKYRGHLGNKTFAGNRKRTAIIVNPLPTLKTSFGGKFSTELVCLPHVFVVGFPKCGSTYTWCFIWSLLRRHLSSKNRVFSASAIDKEPRFWVNHDASIPKATDLGKYLLNFLPALKVVNEKIDIPFIDGSPNTIFNWPHFDWKQPECVNYCLIPSVFSELLHKSKYVVVMRNPINMLYSDFWFSCTNKVNTSREAHVEGPVLFQQRTMARIELFNNCMRDEDSLARCSVNNASDYSSCILNHLHLLDQCLGRIKSSSLEFEGLLPRCGRSRVHMSLYYIHVRKWLSVVPREKMLFLTLEELIKEPRKVAKELLEFLGYQPTDDLLNEVEHVTGSCSRNNQNVVDYKHDPRLMMRKVTKEILETFFQPFNFLLAELLQDKKFLWSTV